METIKAKKIMLLSLLLPFLLFVFSSNIHSEATYQKMFSPPTIYYHDFTVKSSSYTRLCETHDILTVNGEFPGPSLHAHRGDKLIVTVYNKATQNITIHWHGVKQMANPWFDGTAYITQCSIRPGHNFTYIVDLSTEQGTFWWHAHDAATRGTVYGAIIVHPPQGQSYPFPEPYQQVPILLGEWWTKDVVVVYNDALESGEHPKHSDAYTINGLPGYLYQCSEKDTFKMMVSEGKTYLLHIINAAMDEQLFFAIAQHQMTLVGIDGSYTKPLVTDYIMISPGQSMDVLVEANQHPAHYVMASSAYDNGMGAMKHMKDLKNINSMNSIKASTMPGMGPRPMSPEPMPAMGPMPMPPMPPMTMPAKTVTAAFFQYDTAPEDSSMSHVFPTLPDYEDSHSANHFAKHLEGILDDRYRNMVPQNVDEHLFFTISNNMLHYMNQSCHHIKMQDCMHMRHLGSINNISFVQPQVSILHAYYYGLTGVYDDDFPTVPCTKFNYTGINTTMSQESPKFGTKVKVLEYNSTVELVMQGTSMENAESHPMHLHGLRFHVVGWGYGNFDPEKDPHDYNLVNPPEMSTVGVPKNGWATIRFRADNPGVWLLHCHFEHHQGVGMSMVFIVKDGKEKSQEILPAPQNMPAC